MPSASTGAAGSGDDTGGAYLPLPSPEAERPPARHPHNGPVPQVPTLRLVAERRIGQTLGAALRTLAGDFPSYLAVGFVYALAVRGALALFADPLPSKTADETMSHYQDRFQTWAGSAWPVLGAITLILPLVVGILVVMVQEQLGGDGVSIRRAVTRTARRGVVLVVTGVLVTLITAVGLALILPGIFLGVVLCLAAPVAVLEDVSPLGALRRSASLVRRRWWRTALAVVTFVCAELVGLIVPEAIISGIGDPTSGLGLILSAAIDGTGFAFLVICLALLYGDTRARKEQAAETASAESADA
jgi:hypothetical protein